MVTEPANTESVSSSASDADMTRLRIPSCGPTIPSSGSCRVSNCSVSSRLNRSGMPTIAMAGPSWAGRPLADGLSNNSTVAQLFQLINNRLHLVSAGNICNSCNSNNVGSYDSGSGRCHHDTQRSIVISPPSSKSSNVSSPSDMAQQPSEPINQKCDDSTGQQYDIAVLLDTLERRLKYAHVKVVNGCEHMPYE